ncbi:hypothetical protein [Paenibacillus sp. HJGM_3]|uniref:hypothetical protein n=1 Tax=Paenibacillus sp. HJGM_3 TaxID=3379816 RepID=UPI00385A11E7
MSERNSEKWLLERDAIRQFIALYNANIAADSPIRLLYQRERPDAVVEYTRSRRKLGVEITHLYYNEYEAKQLLGRAAPGSFGPESFDQLLIELNHRIERKEAKYASVSLEYPIALLIRNASPTYGLTEFIANADRMARSHHIFQSIWLLTRDGAAQWHLCRLPEEKLPEAEEKRDS